MRPTVRCLVLFIVGIPVSLAGVSIDAKLWTVWLSYVGAALLLTGIDAVLALPKRRMKIRVDAPDQIFIGDTVPAKLHIVLPGKRSSSIGVLPELADDFQAQKETWAQLGPNPEDASEPTGEPAPLGRKGSRLLHEIPLSPRRRGDHAIKAVHLRWRGPLGLIEKRMVKTVDEKVGVVPNIGAVRAIALRMFADQNFMQGLKVERFIGDGSEFESLREYVIGLDHRAMDWKASARHRKLLCQEFRAERNHQVVLAVDAGQLMSEPVGGVPKLDHAINASLLLGWFCLRTGDRVGLVGFDERVRKWAEPAGGMHTFRRLQAMSAEIDYARTETNYTLTLAELSTRLRRRSLVVLFTDFLDTVTAELMIDNVTRLARKHLVLFVAVRDPSLEARSLARPRTLGTLHEAVVAGDFARERTIVLERLKRAGAHCIDTTPDQFSMALVNRYLDIKRRELF